MHGANKTTCPVEAGLVMDDTIGEDGFILTDGVPCLDNLGELCACTDSQADLDKAELSSECRADRLGEGPGRLSEQAMIRNVRVEIDEHAD